ncbi:hypothetical protein [Actinomadura rugatobispora]|uniref:DUF4367 domain-containing protein n=1 Tax=Actinomadura rugatobispora TaxID=1994 RepID=A0ABW1AEQ6_9ACTN|nr:hypothetical protein GCM10010200_054430 [Actinomadura rugatobispora]
MISLKAAVITASTVGAVAVGGVTWASVAQPDAAPVSAHDKLPATVQKAKEAAPKTAPTCLPAAELKKKAAELARKGQQTAEQGAGAAAGAQRQVPDVKDKLPADAKPGTSIQTAPAGKAQVPAAKPGVPQADLPACPPAAPGARTLPKPDAKAPAAPQAPAVPSVSDLNCDKLAPAVPAGGTVERAIMLPKGLKHAGNKAAAKPLGAKQQLCSVTQKWVSGAGTGSWITVERIKTPAQTSEQQLRQALKLPEGGRTTAVNGTVVWQAPAGQSGVLLFDPAGYSLFVNGSPVLSSAGLQDVAQKVAAASKTAR